MTIPGPQNAYLQTFGTGTIYPTVIMSREPTTSDFNGPNGQKFPITQRWINTANNNEEWFLLNYTSSNGVVYANWVNLSVAGGADIIQINGDTGSILPTSGIVTIYADNAAQNCGSSVLFSNSGSTSTLNVTDSNLNTIIGSGSGNSTLTGHYNTTLGDECVQLLTSGQSNVSIGQASGISITSGSFNTLIGTAAGENYTSSESSNILISSIGVVSESNALRIGRGTGTNAYELSTAYIAGINQNTVSNQVIVTIDSSTDQLGVVSVVPVSNGGTGDNSFTAYSVICGGTTSTSALQNVSGLGTAGQVLVSNGAAALPTWQDGIIGILSVTTVDHAASPYTVLSTDQILAVNVSGGIVTIKLPNSTTTGRVMVIKDSNGLAATSNISVTTVGGTVTIDGQTTYTMNVNYQAISIFFDGTNYEVF